MFGLLTLVLAPFSLPALSQTDPSVQRGYELVTQSATRLPGAGNGLNCTSCHLDGGTKVNAAPWTGLASAFPQYSARAGATIALPDRINECMQRSLNRQPLPHDAPDLRDIMAYINWLSTDSQRRHDQRGLGSLERTLVPDAANGRQVFVNRCASCHGTDGAGIRSSSNGISYRAPPLWGDLSFTDGAGMARSMTAAAFIKHNMPVGAENTLTEQEAIDVAQYFTHQVRPVFARKSADWPKGDKPADARN